MEIRYVNSRQLAQRYSVTERTIWRWTEQGVLPKPERIGGRTTRWDLAQVDQYDQERNATPKVS